MKIEPALPQVSERCGVPVLDPRDDAALAGFRFAQEMGVLGRQGAVGGRDGRAVGITPRMAQEFRQTLRERIRGGVLQALGLLVHLLPGIPEMSEGKGLYQPVPPDEP